MKKWYRSNIVKAVLTGLAHVASVVLIIAVLWILACPSAITDVFSGHGTGSYTETEAFSEKVLISSMGIMDDIHGKEQFQTEGKIDRSKIVDVQAYYDKNIVTNQNESGIAYTVEELMSWADAMENYVCASSYYGDWSENPIVVCQKEDGSYEYFYYDEFKRLVEAEELYLVIGDTDWSEKEVLSMIKDGTLYSDNNLLSSVLDKEKRIKYTDCWTFDGVWLEEMYAPQDTESLLDIVNTQDKWNGRLSEVFEMIYHTAFSVRDRVIHYEENIDKWDEGNTNLSYIFANLTSEKLYTNRKAYADYEKLEASLDNLKGNGAYTIVRPTLDEFETTMNGITAENWLAEVKSFTDSEDFVYAVAVDTTLPIPDEYADANQAFLSYAPYMTLMLALAVISCLVIILCVAWLTVAAGRRPEDEEIHLNFFDKWKTEITAGLVIGIWILLCAFGVNLWNPYYYVAEQNMYNPWQLIIAGGIAAATCACFLIGYLSLVRRIKAKTMWTNSLTRSMVNGTVRFTKYVAMHIPALWKTLLVFGTFIILHWIAMAVEYEAFPVVLAILAEVAALFYILNLSIGRKKIHKGIERIAKGDVDYKISLEHLHGQQLEIAEMVNNIGDGLQAAVEKSMKSERLKTDLITNVSHDIKTPLTSIINYIDLLKRENFTDPKVQGYLDILEAKAQRLKVLTEDVVEASKVSSGNITLEKMRVNLVEMIQQTSGEFEEKFKNRGLKEVLNLPEAEAVIYVDGRRMWRVLENIYNNAAKYAMEGTRIYADLKLIKDEVVFSLKNISEQPLNIEAEELTERFIRGDISRNTEGSGLGLSIAKNLTEMQGGKFDIYLDGDLFKVTITFPKC